ncbi:MAG: hypothetical protein WAS56_12445 [Saprospiraceae bacterium]|nr:hypothetical protein [Saprospiraceae bacterium]
MILEKNNTTSYNWDNIVEEKFDCEPGLVITKRQIVGKIKIRKTVYSTNYLADHWCEN